VSRRIDATRLQVGQRIFARVAHDRTGGWSATGYAMRIDAGSTPALALWNGTVADLANPGVTVEVGIPTVGHHAPWALDPLPELLPTAEGALVLTRSLRSHPGACLLRLEDVGEGQPLTWIVSGAGDWIDTEDIGDDWVEIDPATLRSRDAT
jgi:hypothetical protein